MNTSSLQKDIIRPERSAAPGYPSWVTGAIQPEFEKAKVTPFDPAKLKLWTKSKTKNPRLVTGEDIYESLRKARVLQQCLGLRELEEIQKRGVAFYRRFFEGKAIFGWKTVVRDRLHFRYVPYLFEFGDGVYIHWYLLDFAWKEATVLVLA
jgi:hypothetical protein